MKKFAMMAIVIFVAAMLAAPAMAVDVKFKGAFRTEGKVLDNVSLEDDGATDSAWRMRFRLQTDFIISDKLKVVTRIDANDNERYGEGGEELNFDRTYMNIKTSFGMFDIGRMSGGAWGTSFADSEGDRDRFKYTLPIDNFTLLAIIEKNHEGDEGQTISDGDVDTYYVAGVYKMKGLTLGLLTGYQNNKSVATQDTTKIFGLPFFKGKWGNLGLQGELKYLVGETDYDDVAVTDVDLDQLGFNLEGSFKMGPATLELGYAYMSGDDPDTSDDEGFGGTGADWEKLYFLASSSINMAGDLGGIGNLSGDDGKTLADLGVSMPYGGVHFKASKAIKLSLLVGHATALEVPTGVEDTLGTEGNLILNWTLMKNLKYKAVIAYLDAGDFWESVVAEPENAIGFWNRLQINF